MKTVLDTPFQSCCFRESLPKWLAVVELHKHPEVSAGQGLGMNQGCEGLSTKEFSWRKVGPLEDPSSRPLAPRNFSSIKRQAFFVTLMKYRKISDICSRKRPPQGSWNINNSNMSLYNHLSMPVHLLQYMKGVANLWKPIMIYWQIGVPADSLPPLVPSLCPPCPTNPTNCKKTKDGDSGANWKEITCSRWHHLSSSNFSQNNALSIIPNCGKSLTNSAQT